MTHGEIQDLPCRRGDEPKLRIGDRHWLKAEKCKAVMKATKLIVRCLENERVEYNFGVPGEDNVDLLDLLLGSSIRFIMTRREQGAAFTADVYGRSTGKSRGLSRQAPRSGKRRRHRHLGCGKAQEMAGAPVFVPSAQYLHHPQRFCRHGYGCSWRRGWKTGPPGSPRGSGKSGNTRGALLCRRLFH